ncbi:hypothetical protein KJ951_02420 [Patescibacteria group bacterium]|nr:hypothetical protein [Patescibacteria group bacterium]MBU1703236.1 hypothetical protein [Patescibacteria group bacterium]MBU1953836.1 hypothetical protein [Patescibacteria group bacterium]
MKIFFTGHFKNQLKKLMRKFPCVAEDLLNLLDSLDIEKEISIGKSIYKVRIGSSDMKKGKSGGFRAYIYFYRLKKILVPLCIYAKSEQVIVSENELQYHIDKMNEELFGEIA